MSYPRLAFLLCGHVVGTVQNCEIRQEELKAKAKRMKANG